SRRTASSLVRGRPIPRLGATRAGYPPCRSGYAPSPAFQAANAFQPEFCRGLARFPWLRMVVRGTGRFVLSAEPDGRAARCYERAAVAREAGTLRLGDFPKPLSADR